MIGQLFYTGVGSRRTPNAVCRLMTRIAGRMEARGWHLRSGGADGADRAFEDGVSDRSRLTVYVGWKKLVHDASCVCPDGEVRSRAEQMLSEVHPAWDRLQWAARALHTRNAFQVLGSELSSPSRLLICWTPDGAEEERETSVRTGGTRTAIVIACRHGVPVINLARDGAVNRLGDLVRQAQVGE